MTPRASRAVRTVAVLGVLAIFPLVAVTQGLSAVTKPFPKNEDPPICVDTVVDAGDVLRAAGVTVSVINAGDTSGLARRTLDDLEKQGFAGGQVTNVPDPGVRSAQVWAPDGRTAAVRLVQSYLGGKVEVVKRESSVAGITVVVGDQFPGVRKGRPQVKVTTDTTVCGPAGLA